MSLPQAPLSYMKHAMGMQNIEGFRDQRRVGMKSETFVGGGLALHWKLTNTQRRELCLVSLTQMQITQNRKIANRDQAGHWQGPPGSSCGLVAGFVPGMPVEKAG